jgi:GntR family transcriptional regulator/MocR family aminotransferase
MYANRVIGTIPTGWNMRIPLNYESPVPLYKQIQIFLRDQIQSGALAAEMQLPASRELSSSLSVSRITVTNAYAELEAEGLIYTKLGSGTFVTPHEIGLKDADATRTSTGDWPLWQQELLSRTWLPTHREMERLLLSVKHPDPISFTAGMGAEELFPTEEFRKTMNAVLRRDGWKAFNYGEYGGFPPLRADVAHILTNQGIPTSPQEVLITSGSQQAIALVVRLLLRPGEVVLVENPTYVGAIDLFRSLDVRLLGVPMDRDGMIIEAVEDALITANPGLIYTIPTFHNPTGISMSGIRRRQLIRLADRFNVPILEDDCFGDLRYEGTALPALKSLDPGGRVIYINTFSKMLMPGLRVGYLVASGPVIDRLMACKQATDLSTCNPIQRALEAYISVGRYKAHLRRVCKFYCQRRDAMVAALKQYMPPGVQWQTPQGGMFLWLRLPEACSANDLFPLAGEEGVIYAPGSIFFPGEREQPFLRLNFVMNPPEIIQEGIRRLGSAIHRQLDEIKTMHDQPQDQRIVAV